MPSTVVISRSSHSTGRARHERMGRPSTSTVQVPPSPSSHPCLVPMRPSSSRRTSSRVWWTGARHSRSSPFTLSWIRILSKARAPENLNDRSNRDYMRESGMPEALDVSCPCCGALLKVDPETGAVVWADKKKAPAKNFDELVSRVASQKDVLEDKFARSVAQTRNQKDILEKKFEEAKKRSAADPTGRPPNPFDNESCGLAA